MRLYRENRSRESSPRSSILAILAVSVLVVPGLAFALVPESGAEENASSFSSASDSADSVARRDIFDLLDEYVLGRRADPSLEFTDHTGLEWAFVPTFSYNPVYGAAFGALASGAGRRGSTDARYSSLAISGNYTTRKQVQLQLRGDLFDRSEAYLLKSDFRYLDTSRSTWGLGTLESQEGEYPMSFVLARAYATLLRRARGPVYIGVGFHFDEFYDIVDERAEAGEVTPFVEYSGGAVTSTRAVAISLNLIADTRDNLVDPHTGYYLSWSLRNYDKLLGSDKAWQEMWVEARVYPRIPSDGHSVLAFWMYGWISFGPAPYLNLPTNGWDTYGRSARGYLAGRIRGPGQLYAESEYRWSLTASGLFGAVVFVNTTTTTSSASGTFGPLDPAAGAGLRIKFNKHTSTNLTLDYAWGRADSQGLFMGMTEVF